MSDKNSMSYCNTENLYFHLFYSFSEGYNFDIKVGNMDKYLRIELNKEEADSIKEQLGSLNEIMGVFR